MYRHLLTYLLTPCSRVLLEKLTGFAANQQIPRILWNTKVHHRAYKRQPPFPILSQLYPIPTTPPHFLKIHLNIILPSTSWSPQWPLSIRFPHQNPVHTSPFFHTCNMVGIVYTFDFSALFPLCFPLFPLCIFRFSLILLASSVIKKRVTILSIENFQYFRHRNDLLQKSGVSNFFRRSVRRWYSTQSV